MSVISRLAAVSLLSMLVLSGCSATENTATEPGAAETDPSGSMTVEQVCSSINRVEQAAREQLQRALRQAISDAAQRDPDDLVGQGIQTSDENTAYATYEDRLSTLFAGLWPKSDDPDLKSILKDLSRDIYDEPAQNALGSFCP